MRALSSLLAAVAAPVFGQLCDTWLVLAFISIFRGVQPPGPGYLRVSFSKCAGGLFLKQAVLWPYSRLQYVPLARKQYST